MENVVKEKSMKTSVIVKVGVLSIFSYLLMLVEFPLPLFPTFLKMDISDLPAIIGVLTLGPLYGVFIELIKNLLHFVLQTKTAGIGEVANFVLGAVLVVPIGVLYKKNKCAKGYIIGCIVGIIAMDIVACLLNYFIFIPAYVKFMTEGGTPLETNVFEMILFGILPFNIIKGAIVTFIGYYVYKALKPVLNNY